MKESVDAESCLITVLLLKFHLSKLGCAFHSRALLNCNKQVNFEIACNIPIFKSRAGYVLERWHTWRDCLKFMGIMKQYNNFLQVI
jgi:hypothetical protein